MKTLIQGGYVVSFNGTSHEILKDGVIVFENDAITFVGFTYPGPVDHIIDARRKVISPGFINSGSAPESELASMIKNIPTGYIGELSDGVSVVNFLLSDEARYVTGQTLVVSGGRFTGL